MTDQLPHNPASTRDRRAGRDLPMAIAIGVVLAVGFIATTFWSPTATAVFIGLFMVLASVEAAAQLRAIGYRSVVPVLIVTAVVIAVATLRAGHLGQIAGLLVLFLGSAGWILVGPDRRNALARLATTTLLGLWISLLGSFAVLVVVLDDEGAARLLLAIGAVAVADIGAYAVGSAFGRRRIAASLSPNKTWEGLIGGVVLAGITAGLVVPRVSDLALAEVVAVAVAVSLAGFVGDLFESMVKRDLGIKDFGTLLPGHGGIMDRVDGILFGLPVAYIVMVLW